MTDTGILDGMLSLTGSVHKFTRFSCVFFLAASEESEERRKRGEGRYRGRGTRAHGPRVYDATVRHLRRGLRWLCSREAGKHEHGGGGSSGSGSDSEAVILRCQHFLREVAVVALNHPTLNTEYCYSLEYTRPVQGLLPLSLGQKPNTYPIPIPNAEHQKHRALNTEDLPNTQAQCKDSIPTRSAANRIHGNFGISDAQRQTLVNSTGRPISNADYRWRSTNHRICYRIHRSSARAPSCRARGASQRGPALWPQARPPSPLPSSFSCPAWPRQTTAALAPVSKSPRAETPRRLLETARAEAGVGRGGEGIMGARGGVGARAAPRFRHPVLMRKTGRLEGRRGERLVVLSVARS